ncbi:GNAT family N-acetyltransferase [Actinomadura gamaensis]|uniref:GNAT family N-acetyltransferase n=1 Tax=Actinomadura gamaensis TaxID=1763541 RepID=A0ABV9UG77_9ACTN
MRSLDLADPAVLRTVWEIQRAAYAVEAELIGFDGIPGLHESMAELRRCGEHFLGGEDESGIAGAVSWNVLDVGVIEICRLVVHPRAHRLGLASALLDALDAQMKPRRTIVSTGTGNGPALALYQRRGFVPVGERTIAEGVTVTSLERIV